MYITIIFRDVIYIQINIYGYIICLIYIELSSLHDYEISLNMKVLANFVYYKQYPIMNANIIKIKT